MQVQAGREQVGLGGQLGVTGQQDGAHCGVRAEDERAVVDRRAVVRIHIGGGMTRPDHVEHQARPRQATARSQRDEGYAGRHGLDHHGVQLPGRLMYGPDGDGRHRASAQRADQPTDVVGMEVAQHDQRDSPHPQPRQARIHRCGVGTGVDQHHPAGTRRGEHHRVALSHVARHHRPARRRPAEWRDPRRDENEAGAQQHGDEHRPVTRGAGHHEQAADHRSHQQPADDARRPRQGRVRDGRAPLCDGHQPRDERAGQPRAHPCRLRPEGRRQRREHPQDGGRRHSRSGQQVGDDRHRTDLTAETGDHRRGDDEGRQRHRECFRQRRGHPAAAQRLRPGRRAQHQRPRGQHRQGEARVDGQGRIGQQQRQHGGGQRRQGRPTSPHSDGEQRHGGHDRSPHDARRRSGQHDESDHCGTRERGGKPWIGAQQAQQSQHRAGEHRQIRSRHRNQVRQSRRAELVGGVGGESARVADRETRQQAGLGRAERRGRGPAQPRAQTTRGGLPPRRCRELVRRASDPEHRDRQVGARGRDEQAVDDAGGPRQQPEPSGCGSEQEDRAADLLATAAEVGLQQPHGHDDLRRAATGRARCRAQQARIVGQLHPQRRRGASLRGPVQRMQLHQERLSGDHQPGGGRARRHRDQPGRTPPPVGDQGDDAAQHGDPGTHEWPGGQTEEHDPPHRGCRGDEPQVRRGAGIGHSGIERIAAGERDGIAAAVANTGPIEISAVATATAPAGSAGPAGPVRAAQGAGVARTTEVVGETTCAERGAGAAASAAGAGCAEGPRGRSERHQTRTRPRSCANLRSPMPEISRSWSIRV